MFFDLLIRNGLIVDGTGKTAYRADLAVNSKKIADIGDLAQARARVVIPAEGLVVAPGFIDAHSHSDRRLLVYPQAESNLVQGITTVMAGQCGCSAAPIDPGKRQQLEERYRLSLPPEAEYRITWTGFGEYLDHAEGVKLGVNLACLAGHGAIRAVVMGDEDRAPGPLDLKKMKQHTAESMEAGAFGLSSGLIYPPGMFSSTEELIALAQVAARYERIYTSHIRGEGDTVLEAVDEAISIGRRAKLPVHISHHKVSGRKNWGRSRETLALMQGACEQGIDITLDQYPYLAGATPLSTLLPPWAHEGGTERLLKRLRDDSAKKRLRRDMKRGLPGWENFARDLGWENIVVSFVRSDGNKQAEGHSIPDIKSMRNEPDEFTTLFNLLVEEEDTPGMIIFSMCEDDVRRIMRHPLQMVRTDASIIASSGPFACGKPHPRHFGTCPKVLGRYVREYGVLTLEEAVKKMTSLPADCYGIRDRGVIRTGMCADLTVFNPETVIDKATYRDPHRLPDGIEYVFVNGIAAVKQGVCTGNLAGKVLRKS